MKHINEKFEIALKFLRYFIRTIFNVNCIEFWQHDDTIELRIESTAGKIISYEIVEDEHEWSIMSDIEKVNWFYKVIKTLYANIHILPIDGEETYTYNFYLNKLKSWNIVTRRDIFTNYLADHIDTYTIEKNSPSNWVTNTLEDSDNERSNTKL